MFRMKGVIPPVVTPFQKNGEVDYEGVRKLAAFLKKNVDGMFITGSYGSCALLTMEERKKIVETTLDEVAGEIPVVVHVGTADGLSAAKLAKHAVEAGAQYAKDQGLFASSSVMASPHKDLWEHL